MNTTMMKKFVKSAVLASVLFIPAFAMASEPDEGTAVSSDSGVMALSDEMTDIEGHWAADTIRGMQEAGIVKGYADGSFFPDNYITRAEFTTMLNQAINLEDSHADFDDVSLDNWFYQNVANAFGAGIVTGYGDNTFRPNNNINRADVTTMLVRYLEAELDGFDALMNLGEIPDDDMIPDYARSYVSKAVHHEVVKGYNDESFKPLGLTTRAEAVTILDRGLKLAESFNPEDWVVEEGEMARSLANNNFLKMSAEINQIIFGKIADHTDAYYHHNGPQEVDPAPFKKALEPYVTESYFNDQVLYHVKNVCWECDYSFFYFYNEFDSLEIVEESDYVIEFIGYTPKSPDGYYDGRQMTVRMINEAGTWKIDDYTAKSRPDTHNTMSVYDARWLLRSHLNITTNPDVYVDYQYKTEDNKYYFWVYRMAIVDEESGEGHSMTVGYYYVHSVTGEITQFSHILD